MVIQRFICKVETQIFASLPSYLKVGVFTLSEEMRQFSELLVM